MTTQRVTEWEIQKPTSFRGRLDPKGLLYKAFKSRLEAVSSLRGHQSSLSITHAREAHSGSQKGYQSTSNSIPEEEETWVWPSWMRYPEVHKLTAQSSCSMHLTCLLNRKDQALGDRLGCHRVRKEQEQK